MSNLADSASSAHSTTYRILNQRSFMTRAAQFGENTVPDQIQAETAQPSSCGAICVLRNDRKLKPVEVQSAPKQAPLASAFTSGEEKKSNRRMRSHRSCGNVNALSILLDDHPIHHTRITSLLFLPFKLIYSLCVHISRTFQNVPRFSLYVLPWYNYFCHITLQIIFHAVAGYIAKTALQNSRAPYQFLNSYIAQLRTATGQVRYVRNMQLTRSTALYRIADHFEMSPRTISRCLAANRGRYLFDFATTFVTYPHCSRK